MAIAQPALNRPSLASSDAFFSEPAACATRERSAKRICSGRVLSIERLESRLVPSGVTYTSTDVPKPIPDLGTITSALTVPDSLKITDVNVHLAIIHPWDADLDVSLIAPDSTRIRLFTHVGGSGDDFNNTVLDDQATKSIASAAAPFAGSFRPAKPLKVLNGKEASGTWMLELKDDQQLLTGTLNSWSLEFNSGDQKTAFFDDSDGDQMIVKLKGAGSVEIDPAGPKVVVTGGNSKTSLSIAVNQGASGDGHVTLTGIQAPAFKSLTAPAVQLTGDFSSSNYVTNLSLWGINGSISAPGFGNVTVGAGGFDGTLDATDDHSLLGSKAGIRGFKVKGGNINGAIESAGNLGQFQVLKDKLSNGGTVADSSITATAIKALRIDGTMADSLFLAGAFPKSVTINGGRLAPLTNPSLVLANSNSFSGNVFKGPVTGATVTFYILNPDGTTGRALGQTFTDANASFTVRLAVPTTQPFLAVARGGSYIDEVTGQIVNLNATDTFDAVLPAGTTESTITPLTNMAASLALAQASASPPIPLVQAVNSANNSAAIQYNLPDILGVIPVAANDATQLATASLPQRQYGLVLAGITQLAANLNVRAADLAAWLAADFSDGILDGLRFGADIPIRTISGVAVTLPPTTGRDDLQAAITQFINSANNKTNLIQAAIVLTPVQYGLNAAGRLYTNSTVLPAGKSGEPYSATLRATGGTPAYTWSLQNGLLPPGFALSPQGVISAPGSATTLPLGTTMTISPPFTVRVQDVAGNTREIELRITIVEAGPDITGLSPITAVEGQAYSGALGAIGGELPYYWYNSAIDGGFRPYWLSIDLDGTVHGTPPIGATGSYPEMVYNFGVTVVDLIGQTKSTKVGLVVKRASGIDVTPTSGLVTTESHGKASFTVVLHSQPEFDVVIPIQSNNTDEGTASKSQLTFTNANWNKPQTVTVTGVDDLLIDGDIPYTVTVGPASSTDSNYNGLSGHDVALINKDNDNSAIAGVWSGTYGESVIGDGGFTYDSAGTMKLNIEVARDGISLSGTAYRNGIQLRYLPSGDLYGYTSSFGTLDSGAITSSTTLTGAISNPIAETGGTQYRTFSATISLTGSGKHRMEGTLFRLGVAVGSFELFR